MSRHFFLAGTRFGETEAQAEVWSKHQASKEAADKLRDSVDGYQAAVVQGDRAGIGKTFNAVGEACKGCHKHFREKHKH